MSSIQIPTVFSIFSHHTYLVFVSFQENFNLEFPQESFTQRALLQQHQKQVQQQQHELHQQQQHLLQQQQHLRRNEMEFEVNSRPSPYGWEQPRNVSTPNANTSYRNSPFDPR
jgi:transcription initiation factor TFIID subunit TAF12